MSYQEHVPSSNHPSSLHNRSYELAHNRSYSSPAPLSPQLPQQYPPPLADHHVYSNCGHPHRNACHINAAYVSSPPVNNKMPSESVYGRQNYAHLNISH